MLEQACKSAFDIGWELERETLSSQEMPVLSMSARHWHELPRLHAPKDKAGLELAMIGPDFEDVAVPFYGDWLEAVLLECLEQAVSQGRHRILSLHLPAAYVGGRGTASLLLARPRGRQRLVKDAEYSLINLLVSQRSILILQPIDHVAA